MLHRSMQLRTSIHEEIASHFRLLSVEKKDVLSYLSSPYRLILIAVFTILFIPHVFVVVEDLSFAIAYEVDPGSIIASILALFRNYYNMNGGYHSQYYGWTYFSIDFLLLLPIHIAMALGLVKDYHILLVAIRFVFFMIGLASVLAFFEVAQRTFKQGFLSFASAFLFIMSPTVFGFFYFLHPETTGLLFLFLGVLCLIRFNEGSAKDYRWYTVGLLTLVLSSLSKQVFFITALPVLLLFVYVYCHHHNRSVFRFLLSIQFIKSLLGSIALAVFVFFVINPFAFLQPAVFIKNQISLLSVHMQGTRTRAEAIGEWVGIAGTIPVISVSVILLPLTLLGAAIFGRDQKVGRMLYIVNIVSAILFVAIIVASSRYLISSTYFAPVYPFFVLNIMSIPLYIIRKWNVRIVEWLTIVGLAYFLFFAVVSDVSISIPAGYDRLIYQDSLVYGVYSYIEGNVPDGSKIAYDQFAAIPSNRGIIGCSYWQGCGTDYIEEFQPDYVLFVENWTFQGTKLPENARLMRYISDHHFILVETIVGDGLSLGVWKNPGK